MPEPADWPAPVETVNEAGTADIVLLCEHASNHMPAAYGGLGLPPEQLQRHIAWDIGAAELTRRLSRLLDAAAFLGTYSLLLIDLNRPLQAPDSIPIVSEGTSIPGNIDLEPAEVSRRVEAIFTPFHRRVAAHLDQRLAARRRTRLVSIHSFTPVFFGVARPWHAGVLFLAAGEFGAAVLQRLSDTELLVGANVPYKTDRLGDYAIPVYGDDRGIPAIMIEIRSDGIQDPDGIEQWSLRIARALRQLP